MDVEEEHPPCGGGQSSSCASQSRALTIEAEIMSLNKQRDIDLLEAELQEATDIVINLRSELRWVTDKLEEARVNVVNKEKEETILAHPEVVANQSSLRDDECGGDDEKQFDGLSNGFDACESEVDADIRNKKFELSRNGCTQRIHDLKRKSSPCANEEERRETEKDSEENLSLANRRCLFLARRARNAEVIPVKPSNELGIKKRRKLQGRRKRRWGGKRKATAVRSQSQLIKPCQSQSNISCSKTSVENSDDKDSMDTQLLVENEEVDDLNACKGLEEHLQHCADGIGIIRKKKRSKNVENVGAVNPTDHLASINVEDEENRADIPENGTKIEPLPRLDPGLTSVNSNVDLTLGTTNATIIGVIATNRSTDKDLKSSMVPSTKTDIKIPSAPPRTPGSIMPPFSHLSDLIRERYLRFAEKIGEVMIEFNHTVVSYEDQLGIASSSNEVSSLNRKISDLETTIQEMRALEEDNAERANKIRSRMLQAEADLAEADTARIDLTEKLKVGTNVYLESQEELARMRAKVEELELRNQLLESGNRAETEKAKSEERKKLRADYREKMGELKKFLEEFERISHIRTRAAETKENRLLLEEIRRGEIKNIEAELEVVKADEEEAAKKAAEVSALQPDLPKFDLLFDDSPEVEEDVLAQQPELIINESGSNLNNMGEQDE